MAVDYSLYLVADVDFAGGRDLVELVEAGVSGGVTIVQLRGKDLSFREFLELGVRMVKALEKPGVPLLINDRVEIALACGAAGIHLGLKDVPVRYAREMLGKDRIIGLSVNTLDEAHAAEEMGADYVGLGPVYATSTKSTDLPLLGPEGIRAVKPEIGIPVVAIGGITLESAGKVAAAGADGIAVVSAILGAEDAERAARDLRRIIEGKS